MKKGFSLVELLAVIAIIAILSILVLPNIVSLFNNSKADTFIVDIKSRFNTLDLNIMKQSVKDGNATVFYRFEGDENKVPLTGKQLYYYVKVTNGGKIEEMLVWDKSNTLKKKDTNGISITNLSTDDLVKDIDTSNMTLEKAKQIIES